MKTTRLNLWLPADLVVRLRELAKRNDRTLKAEMVRGLEKHLKGAK